MPNLEAQLADLILVIREQSEAITALANATLCLAGSLVEEDAESPSTYLDGSPCQ